MSDIEWADPPANRVGLRKWHKAAQVLRDNPGQWARFGPESRGNAGAVQSRFKQGMYGKGFEATTRTVDGEVYLFVKWNGEGQ